MGRGGGCRSQTLRAVGLLRHPVSPLVRIVTATNILELLLPVGHSASPLRLFTAKSTLPAGWKPLTPLTGEGWGPGSQGPRLVRDLCLTHQTL